jgi:hypothetical protein
LANDFANSLIKKSMRVAQHRNAVGSNSKNINDAKRKRVEAEDVAIVLKKNYNIAIPGLPNRISRDHGGSRGKPLSSVAALGHVGLGPARAQESSRSLGQTEGDN